MLGGKRRISAFKVDFEPPAKSSRASDANGGELQATVRRWGKAWSAFESPNTFGQQPLWQIQVVHSGRNSFGYQLLATVKAALENHEMKDLPTLESKHGIKIFTGAPPQSTEADPDGVGMQSWRPVVYVAGANPIAGLKFIQLIIDFKVQRRDVVEKPRMVLQQPERAWCFGLMPPGWLFRQSEDVPRAFEAQPPRGRRHVIMQLECRRAAGDKKEYMLSFFGGIYPFRDRFDHKAISGAYAELDGGDRDYIRCIKFVDLHATKILIEDVLGEGVLDGTPVFFANAAEEPDEDTVDYLAGLPSVAGTERRVAELAAVEDES